MDDRDTTYGNWRGSLAPQGRPEGAVASRSDALPPHSPEAEIGVLGCCLLDPGACVKQARRQIDAEGKQFFDLRHRLIWQAICGLEDAGTAVDVVTLMQRLKDYAHLDAAGGLAYFAAFADQVPSAANLSYYLDIVREKLTLRNLLALCSETSTTVYQWEGTVTTMLARIEENVIALKRAARDPAELGRRLKKAIEYGDEYWASWFGDRKEEPGHKLPESAFGTFPFKIRTRELTFVLGEKGAGKTTLLCYLLLFLCKQGMKAGIASMEMHPADTLKILASQLLGTRRLPDNEWGHARARAAFDWLSPRVQLYDFLGIAPWRELLQEMYISAESGLNLFILDSVMRLGIADDDYAEQGECARRFAEFCMTTDSHVMLINHLNKSDKSRGSQQWIDNSHNVVAIRRNEKRAEFLAELQRQVDEGLMKLDQKYEELKAAQADKSLRWSSKFELRYQRWPGAQQNASRYLLFNLDSLQLYDERWHNPEVNWLEEWGPPGGPRASGATD